MPSILPSRPATGTTESTAGATSPGGILPTYSLSTLTPPAVGLGDPGSLNQSVLNYNNTALGQYMRQKQQQMLIDAGLPADADSELLTNAATVRDLSEETIAKIASINPDVAKELAAHLEGAPPDQGIFDSMKDFAGDLLSPALSLGGKALDILVRPGRIIPELIVDEENDPWYEDIGQALSGNSTASGAKVLDKWGVKNGWAQGLGGFVFDVAADPLTYVGVGLLGRGAKVAGEVGAKTLGAQILKEGSQELGEAGLKASGKSVDEIAALVDEFSERLVSGGSLHTDAAAGAAAHGFSLAGVNQKLLDHAISEASTLFARTVRGVTPRTLPAQTKELLKKGMAEATDPMTKRAIAGNLGGIRLIAGVPFSSSLRYTSAAIPFTEALSFRGVANLFRGTSGLTRLMKYTATMPPADAEAVVQVYLREGYKGLERDFPDIARSLVDSTGRAGTMHMRLSEQLGRVTGGGSPAGNLTRTRGLSPHAATIRIEGLPGLAAYNAGRHAASLQKQLYESSHILWKDDFGGAASGIELSRSQVRKALTPILKADADTKARITQHLTSVPSRALIEGPEDALREHMLTHAIAEKNYALRLAEGNTQRIDEINDKFDRAVQLVDRKIEKMRDVHFGNPTLGIEPLTEEMKAAIEVQRRLFLQTAVDGNRAGLQMGSRTSPLEYVDTLNPQQVREWATYGRADLKNMDPGHELYVDVGYDEAIRPHHIGSHSSYTPGEEDYYGRGYRFGRDADEADGLDPDGVDSPIVRRRVAIRMSNPAIDRPGFASDTDTINSAFKEARAAVDAQKDALVRRNPVLRLNDPENWEKFAAERTDELATKHLQDQGFEGIVKYDKDDNVLGGVVFHQPDRLNVRLVDAEAANMTATGAYFPHVLTDAARTRNTKSAVQVPKIAEFAHEHHRTLSDDVYHANDELKELWGLKPGQEALELDPLVAFDKYAIRVSDETAMRELGMHASAMQEVYGRFTNGAVVATNVYKSEKGNLTREVLERFSEDELRAHDKVNERTLRHLNKQERNMQEFMAQKLLMEQADVLREGGTRLASAARQMAKAEMKNMGAIQRHIDTLSTKLKKLKTEKKKVPGRTTEVTDFKTEKRGYGQLERGAKRQAIKSTEIALVEAELAAWKNVRRGLVEGHVDPSKLGIGELMEKRAAEIEKFVTRTVKRSITNERQLSILRMQVESAQKGLNDVRARLDTLVAQSTPALVSSGKKLPGYVDIGAVVPQLKGLAMHPHIAQEFTTALRGRDISDIQKAWRQWVNGPWKRWATLYYPGFHARNNMGAWFNNMLQGVTIEDYIQSLRISNAARGGKWADVKLTPQLRAKLGLSSKKNLTYFDLAEIMHNHGIRSANSQAMADTGDNLIRFRAIQEGKAAGIREKVQGAGSTYGRVARGATEVTENFHRGASFVAGLRETGGSIMGARMATMMRHGDYEDLNDFEQIIKDLVPFYKWMRTNLPYQIHNLLEAPGKHLAVLKAGDAAYTVQGMDPHEARKRQPKWLQEAFTVPLPIGKDGNMLLSLDLPMSDLYTGANDYLSSLLPIVKPFIESKILKQSVFTGAPLGDKQVPLAGWAQLPGIRHVMEDFVKYDAEGNPTINDGTQNLFSAIPVFARFRTWVFADPKSMKGRASALTSAMFGVRFRNDGPDELEAAELAFYYDEIEPLLVQLRELGVTLPSKDMLTPEVFEYLGFEPPADKEVTTTTSGGGILPTTGG